MKMIFRFLFFLLFIGSQFQVHAQQANPTSEWINELPKCPCKNPDSKGVQLSDGWAKDKGNLNKYHKGATVSFRSYPYIQTSAGKSGQQCCYDDKGNLITSGQAAGTPDKASTSKGEDNEGFMKVRIFSLVKHYNLDVKPWKRLMKSQENGWQIYNKTWVPDRGNSCKTNEL